MATLMQASREWASRPADQRFLTMRELGAFQRHHRTISRAATVSTRKFEARPAANDPVRGIEIVSAAGVGYAPTHWGFGQLATLSGAPAGYLRDLPAPLAADCINYGLKFKRDAEDVQLLLRKNGESVLAAATGPNYGRIWNSDVTDALIDRFDGSDWKVPGEFGKDVLITKANTTLFASDRDMFVFLADEKNRIEMKNRRPGLNGSSSLARGFFAWNSEVGSATLGVATFLFDYACSNRIVWGAEGFREIKIRHTASAPDRFIEQILPVLDDYQHSSARSTEQTIEAAQNKRIENITEFLASRRYSKSNISGIIKAHVAEEDRPIETIWDAVTGITAFAKSIAYQDERITLERDAGKLLDLVAVR